MAKDFCRDRLYQTKAIVDLPREFSFADGAKSLSVDYATTDQLDQCRKMIEEAAARGDNVGVDEYEIGSDSTRRLLDFSEIFQAIDPSSGRIEAFMIVQPCFYQRSHDPFSASVYVFRSKDIDDAVHAELLSLVTDFAKDIDVGYCQCFTQVALCLHGLYQQLRKRGFLTVAVLPNWVNIAGATIRDSAIMFKNFGLPERQIRSSEEVRKIFESDAFLDQVYKEYTSVDIHQIPGLPKIYPLESGTKLVLRNARKAEDHVLYQMFYDAEEKGDGCSVHEFPSLNSFRLEVLAYGYVAVIEEEKTDALIGMVIFRDANMSRSGRGKICDESIIVNSELRGKGFSNSFVTMSLFVETALGYERVLWDAFITNSRVLKLWKHDAGVFVCGVLPNGGFHKGVGWVDLLLSVREVEQKPMDHLQETTKSRL